MLEKGRIDGDLMYEIVKKWGWGNSGSPEIYHDPQTRRQGISFRISIARAVEKLIETGQLEKAKELINIAVDNMPVAYFGYYPFIEPFVDGYFKVGEPEKARGLFRKLKQIYQERLRYVATLPVELQYRKMEDTIADLQAYQRNVDILAANGDKVFAETETLEFNGYVSLVDRVVKGE